MKKHKLTRDEMEEELINKDIQDIKRWIYDDNYEFLYYVLKGNCGWKQYYYLTNKEIELEYEEMKSEEDE